MVPINVARVSAGEGAITELVADPLRPDVVCRRCDLWRPDPRRPEVLCASYQTLDAREKKSESMKDYIAGLTPEEKTERLDKARAGGFQDGEKISDGASRRSI